MNGVVLQLFARKRVGQFAPDKVGQFNWIVQFAFRSFFSILLSVEVSMSSSAAIFRNGKLRSSLNWRMYSPKEVLFFLDIICFDNYCPK